jgi:hypothetical protein
MAHVINTTKQAIGKLAFSTSALLTAADANAFQGLVTPEPSTSRYSGAVAQAESSPTLGSLSAPTKVARLRAIQNIQTDHISYDSLPPPLQLDPEVIVAALGNPRIHAQVLPRLTAAQLQVPEIAAAVVKSSPYWVAGASNYPEIVKSPQVAETLLHEILSPTGSGNPYYAELCIHLSSSAPLPFSELLSVGARLAAMRQVNNILAGMPKLSDLSSTGARLPQGSLSLTDMQGLLSVEPPSSENIKTLQAIRFANLPQADSHVLLDTLQYSPKAAMLNFYPEEFSPSMTKQVVEYIRNNPQECAAIVKERGILLENCAIMQAASDLIATDITIAPELPKTPQSREICVRAIRQYLNSTTHVDYIAQDVLTELSNLLTYPRHVLEVPTIRNAVFTAIQLEHQTCLRNQLLFGNPGTVKSLPQLIEKFVDDVPELAGLIQHPETLKESAALRPDLFAGNPRAGRSWANHEIDNAFLDDTARCLTELALKTLGIRGLSRFDNAAEILVNRLHASDPETRARLETLFSPASPLQTRLNSISSDPTLDTRPLCLVIACTPESDHNGAFNSVNERGRDLLDPLMSYYRVVYFEVENGEGALKCISETYKHLGKKIELMILAGHGGDSLVSLGQDNVRLQRSTFTPEHGDSLELLQEAFDPKCRIIIESCSTAKRFNDEPSLAERIHAALPFTTVYAPNLVAVVELKFKTTGELDKVKFIGADRIALLPHSNVPLIEERGGAMGIWLLYATHQIRMFCETLIANWRALFAVSILGYLVDKTQRKQQSGLTKPVGQPDQSVAGDSSSQVVTETQATLPESERITMSEIEQTIPPESEQAALPRIENDQPTHDASDAAASDEPHMP